MSLSLSLGEPEVPQQRLISMASRSAYSRSLRRSLSRSLVCRPLLCLLALIMAASACTSDQPTTGTTTASSLTSTTTTSARPSSGFDDHTVGQIESIDEFFALGRGQGDDANPLATVKFTIPDLEGSEVHWFDSNFYQLHDEWYWFRLLNGQRVPGLDTEPVDPPMTFETIEEIYVWAQAQGGDLPLDLRFTSDGDRLYSDRYYQLVLRDPDKTYGVGSLINFPPIGSSDRDRWVIELEFSELTTPESVGQFIDRLGATLPTEIGDRLEWVVRSPAQEETAQLMISTNDRYADRVVHYSDLVEAGQVAVYNEGITAGRLLHVKDASDLNNAKSSDILLMENVPDYLPPAAALLTSAPQTPLAHVNLLARNRGIPNASVAGLLDDPSITQAARIRGYAVVQTSGTEGLAITLITKQQYDDWNNRPGPSEVSVPQVDLDATATVMSLTELAATIDDEDDVEELRPVIGGKSAGFLALLGAEGVTTPDFPLAITVAPYFDHLTKVEAELEAMLSDADFKSDSRVRFLLLEGSEEFLDTYESDADAEFLEEFDRRHPNGPIRVILDADGFMNLFRDVDLDEDDLDEITDSLTENFASFTYLQGLRFRSSSSVEDIEGFVGAGLYDSNTGYLKPDLLPDEDDHKRTVERAIKKTWASYWSAEAFEERKLANVDHRSGGMGVLVHARFDDPLEVNNGVATFTLLPGGGAEAVINTQLDDVSVTNPDPLSGDLPEEVVVTVAADGSWEIERVASSTLVPDGVVLDDDAIGELVEQLQSVALLWRDRVNSSLPELRQIETITLDYEFRTMDTGWPAVQEGIALDPRLIVKQARSLDPGLRGIPAEVLALEVPRDVLARASLVNRVRCPDGEGFEVFTDPMVLPDVGYSVEPFVLGAIADRDTVVERDTACTRTQLYVTPARELVELLATGEGLAAFDS